MIKPPFTWLTDAAYSAHFLAERALLWAAYYADVVKPREVPMDSNRGEWVEKFLKSAGVAAGNPWCASFVTYCYKQAGVPKWAIPSNPASVYGWARNGTREGKLSAVTKPQRGDLFYWLNADNHGHIGFVVKVGTLFIETIEGNAQPGESGNQREGGGVYRRKRLRTRKIKFLRTVVQVVED